MFNPGFYVPDPDDPMAMYPPSMMRRNGPRRRFDEYYRCYPVAMLPGPDRQNVTHGGKVFMPPSALDKLTRLEITYPMLFELINGSKDRMTHAGVLEFIAEEGKIYLPYWMMQTLLLEPGDLLQIKSTDLPSGSFIKLQPQSTAFLDITDPKAVLEKAMRDFACLTKGDVFSFSYNNQVYEIAVLETKPHSEKNAICVLETDLEVDFAAPLGYVEPTREKSSGTSTPRSIGGAGVPTGGLLHNHGSMAQAINYSSIAPSSNAAVAGSKATSSNFLTGGQKLSKKGSKNSTPVKPSTPVAGLSSNAPPPLALRKTNGPQPLRLPLGKLFFGYEIRPVKKTDEEKENDPEQPRFQGAGHTLRAGAKRKSADTDSAPKSKSKDSEKNTATGGQRLGGRRDVK